MKTKIILLLGAIILSLQTFGQGACSAYYPFEEGTKFVVTSYNKKGKTESSVKYEVTKASNNVASLSAKVFDDKNKEITQTGYDVTCDGETISIDFQSLLNPEILKQYKDMDMELTGSNIEFPTNLEVGQDLKDANMNMAIDLSGMKMNIKLDMVDRKVISKESITTPAGTFDCFVLTYTTEMKMGVKQRFQIKEWVAKGVGMVRSEHYSKNGKLSGYSELTSFSK